MKTSEELLALKMTLKTLSVKVKRIENVNKQLKKLLVKKEPLTNKEEEFNPSKRRMNYFNSPEIQQRLRNIVSAELTQP